MDILTPGNSLFCAYNLVLTPGVWVGFLVFLAKFAEDAKMLMPPHNFFENHFFEHNLRYRADIKNPNGQVLSFDTTKKMVSSVLTLDASGKSSFFLPHLYLLPKVLLKKYLLSRGLGIENCLNFNSR